MGHRELLFGPGGGAKSEDPEPVARVAPAARRPTEFGRVVEAPTAEDVDRRTLPQFSPLRLPHRDHAELPRDAGGDLIEEHLGAGLRELADLPLSLRDRLGVDQRIIPR